MEWSKWNGFSISERPPLGNPSKVLDEFRDQAAWVLLGEPGAGKTEAFKKEAEATG